MSATTVQHQGSADPASVVRFTIDGREVEVPSGGTILQGARRLGIDIPTLCHLERCGPMTSCLVCVVRLTLNGRTSVVPSCAMKAVPGMVVESETAEVHELRRSALELLLSDHVGDCLSPCARLCPLGLNIPQMLRQVQSGAVVEAAGTVRASLALPRVLGRLCHKPCENGCRRGACDSAAAIRDVERFVADALSSMPVSPLPPRTPSTGKRVAVVGSGPAGMAAAYELLRQGHACVVFDRHATGGGSLRGEVERGALAAEVLRAELADLGRAGAEFRLGVEIGTAIPLDAVRAEFDAVVVATGSMKADRAPLLPAGPSGLKAEPGTGATAVDGVFAAGSAVRPQKQIVKAMADGQTVAGAVELFLRGEKPARESKPFSSVMGRLEPTELNLFLRGANPGQRIELRAPGGVYTLPEASTESARCLHCDCRAAGNCGLQHYAQVYRAEFGRFPRQRRTFEQHQHPARVLFEPGKCILCGICVAIASEAAEPLGLTFVGRGFEVRVSAPLDEPFERGLEAVAEDCAQACPTGAIVLGATTDQHWAR